MNAGDSRTAYNDLSRRAETDHTEIKPLTVLIEQFSRDGLWGDTTGTCLITDHKDTLLGTIGFNALSEFELEVGYRILAEQHRRKGYISEVLPLFSAYLFETRPIKRLRIQIASDNIVSQRVAEKSGYRREGVLRQGYFYRGRFCDFVIYGLLRDECPELRELMV